MGISQKTLRRLADYQNQRNLMKPKTKPPTPQETTQEDAELLHFLQSIAEEDEGDH